MSEPKKGLKFYPASHRYKLDGGWVQGVTTLIKGGLPNDALKYWSARNVAEYVADNRDQVFSLYDMGRLPMVGALKEVPWQFRDKAAVRGTEVHDFAERIVNGDEVDVPEHLVGYVESCVQFLDDWKIEPVLVEAVVGSREHRYAGKLDLVAGHRRSDGDPAIFDYKTSRSGIYPETAFQETAYAFAEFHGEDGDESPLPPIERAYGVQLLPERYEVYPLEFGRHVFAEFLAIAGVARIAKRTKRTQAQLGYVGLAVTDGEAV